MLHWLVIICSVLVIGNQRKLFIAFLQMNALCDRLLQLARVGGPGLVGFEHGNATLSPRHWGHRYETLLPMLLERYRDTNVRLVQLGSVFGECVVRCVRTRATSWCSIGDVVMESLFWSTRAHCDGQ